MYKFMCRLGRLFLCYIMQYHDWTCAAAEGIKPTEEQLASTEGFWDYVEMTCKYCGKISSKSR